MFLLIFLKLMMLNCLLQMTIIITFNLYNQLIFSNNIDNEHLSLYLIVALKKNSSEQLTTFSLAITPKE